MKKKIALIFSVAVILLCGIYAAFLMAGTYTYDGTKTDVVALMEDPTSYDNSQADGVASVMVNENLDKTVSENAVYSVVFNFRGYDTLGESFILIAAISGSMAILRQVKKKEQEVQ